MFGIGGWEFILIAVLALLLFGPDKLPQFARTIGRFMRDFKRYQDLMESTIRAEMFAADPGLRKDAFENAKEFRKKVAGGGFSKVEAESTDEESVDEAPAEEEPIDIITGKPGPPANEEPDEEPLVESDSAAEPAPAEEQVAEQTDTPSAEGEGERDEA